LQLKVALAEQPLLSLFFLNLPDPLLKKSWNFGIFLECPCKSKCYKAKKFQTGKKILNRFLEFNLTLSVLRILNDAQSNSTRPWKAK